MLTQILVAALMLGGTSPATPARKLEHRTADSLDVGLYARILRSADQRVLDTVLVATGLSSTNVEMRRVAARTVSQVALRHRRRALPLLRVLATDADSVVASSAVFGLGLVRDTSSVGALAAIVRQGGAGAASAAWSLGEIGAPSRDTLAALLAEEALLHRPAAQSEALLIAESKMRPVQFAAVQPYLHAADTTVRWAAAYALARQRTAAGVRALLDATSENAAFRAEVARMLLAQIAGDSLRDRALVRLHALVDDADPFVRINALRSLATFGEPARASLLRGMNDRDANVRVAAAQSAGTVFGAGSAAWGEAWSADTGYKFRKSLLAAAASAGHALPAAGAWEASPDWRLRHAVLESWSGSRDTLRMRALALQMIQDRDARVRAAAYSLLISTDTARQDSVVQRAVSGARTDPDSTVRNLVPGGRARSLDTAAVERPIEFYVDAVERIVLPTLRHRPPRAVMRTVRGNIVMTFDGVDAPLTTMNYLTLAQKHYYDHLSFHRVVPGFVAQDGDPRGDGEGGPGYAIRDELTLLPYSRGAIGMALSGPDTGGSQYFFTLAPQPHLTGHYTVFAHVTAGLGAMDALVEGDAIRRVVPRW